MKQNKKKTAFLPCKIFKHDGATLTVGVSETTINDTITHIFNNNSNFLRGRSFSRQTERWRSLRPY